VALQPDHDTATAESQRPPLEPAAPTGQRSLLEPAAPTEQRNPRTLDIDVRPALEVLRLLNAEDATVATAVQQALPELAQAVDWVVEAIRAGGRVHYFGAGTSGRIAVLDAAEVGPTFGLPDGVFVAHQAGGERALRNSIEDVEDDVALGGHDAASVTAADVAIGITASGRTPYVAGALRAARQAGARTVLFSSNPDAPLAELADCHVRTDTGPEAIGGSTRLKAGTAHKMALNGLSTAAMIHLGRTYSNLMVSVDGLNSKLRSRQLSILREASGAPADRCRTELSRCDGNLRLALLCLLSGQEPGVAAEKLLAAGGSVRRALVMLPSEGAR
jgi:N-acetylmuramic acid 6-phosphate etherase